jgi:hypothetical protein
MSEKIKELLSYYNKAPDPMMYKKANETIGQISDQKQELVIDWILEHVPKRNGLDVPGIRIAMAECGCSVPTPDEAPREWVCDACGLSFQRVTVSNTELRKHGIHDYCPRCGLAPTETENARWYANKIGKTPPWYEKIREECRSYHMRTGARPHYDKKADEDFDKEQMQKKIDQMKAEAQAEVRKLTESKEALHA